MLSLLSANGTTNGTSLPKAKDFWHHLNSVSRNRVPSPLKDLVSRMNAPGMISLAGGLPHPGLFPIQSLSFSAIEPDAALNSRDPMSAPPPSEQISATLTKAPGPDATFNLCDIFQYNGGRGIPSVEDFVRGRSAQLEPAYADWEVLLHAGNTEGWKKVIDLLCEEGDTILVEAFTFSSSQAVWAPMGITGVPVALDSDGLRADDLERIMSSWESERPGEKRPKLMYVVPIGQNPTGSNMPAQRKKDIIAVCDKWDIIICEDDPYSSLQFPTWTLGAESATEATVSTDLDTFLAGLSPSFLKFDTQGRVIRLDTFSKTLCPGARVGWFTANAQLIERILRATEVNSQSASGFSLGVLGALLEKWGQGGYNQWLATLKAQYQIRRDWMCEALSLSFASLPASIGDGTVECSLQKGQKPIFSFLPPTSGMFVWLEVDLSDNKGYHKLRDSGKSDDPEKDFLRGLWEELADHGVLLAPGSYYVPHTGKNKPPRKEGVGHFRLAFSLSTKSEMLEGVERIQRVFAKSWAATA